MKSNVGFDRVLVISINSYYSKVPSTGTAVLLRSAVPTTVNKPWLSYQLFYGNAQFRSYTGYLCFFPIFYVPTFHK